VREPRARDLLVLVGEEELEDLAVGDHGVPAHPGHPALQPFHPHLDKLLLEAAWEGRSHATAGGAISQWEEPCSSGRRTDGRSRERTMME